VRRGRRVVAIVGATGLVGSEIARQLFLRRFPLADLLLFSSGRTPETETTVGGVRYGIRPFSLEETQRSDICFLAAGGWFSRTYAAEIASRGNTVIDNSSAFRMARDVPLVVPEVNPDDIGKHTGIIANPNCSTIQMVVVLAPLSRHWRLRRVVVSTYQAVTGAGLRAAGELAAGSCAVLEGESQQAEVFPHQMAFNLIPQIDVFDREGWTREERKLMNETRKIMGDESIDVTATAVRVPVFRSHSESVYAEFEQPVDADYARRILREAPGVSVVDDPARGEYPMPVDAAGRPETFVGRLRGVPGCPKAMCMWIVSDNLLKGAALNAVQIAERLP
jgi:aspartate-semialdehyde dehydrogenase